MKQVAKGFESKRQFPNCFGAIDCSQFLFSTPAIAEYKGYYDRHGTTSVTLQAVVDSQGRFIDTYAGCAGSVNDARVFELSPLSKFLFQGKLQEPVVEVDGVNVKPYMVGDAGYALSKHCIIPYCSGHLSDPVKERFTFYQSSTRIIVEQAFGRLKGRFKWLNSRITVHNPMLHADIINVGCILHNLMMDCDVRFDKQWLMVYVSGAAQWKFPLSWGILPSKAHSQKTVASLNRFLSSNRFFEAQEDPMRDRFNNALEASRRRSYRSHAGPSE